MHKLRRQRTDPEKTKYVHRSTGTVEDQRAFIRRQRETPGDYLFLIEDLQGNPIGMKGLSHYDAEKKETESGRFMGFGSQVQNIEALKLSFDFAFDELGVDRIIMSALENNSVMLGIQKRFGVEFTHREPCEGFEFDNLFSVLTREAYAVSKPKIEALIDRFANR